MNTVTLNELKAIPALENVPDDQLEWLIAVGETVDFEEGTRIFDKGNPLDKTYVILEGRMRICAEQNGKMREVTVLKQQTITGYLPFSRAVNTFAYGEAIEKCRAHLVLKDKIDEGIKLHYELTAALVHTMTSRVRDFTSQQQQNEKMFALGKLSAGLAHELNNPASAISRGASALQDQIKNLPEIFKEVAALSIAPEKIDTINHILVNKTKQTNRPVLTMMQRADLEDNLSDWLADHDIKDFNIAENLAEFGFTTEDLEHMNSCTPQPKLVSVLDWMSNYLLQEKMVSDIKESSARISELVNSVKTFTHMDRDTDKQLLDIHAGIRNTLTMLNYKLRKGNIQVQEDFDLNLPQVKALAGELNQVWTNMIDNAIDAMEANGSGILTIRTQLDREFVCVYIKDNGVGIPPETQSKIFDPFFTTKDMGKGTGLGLDVVTRIIRQHSGTVKVASVPGNTEFTVCFPLIDN
ncbi:ATP-binding protein [Mucilaginibacter phyllosphaerae]|uniref:histidine kinase n=1 Tax=Mucilaginibacter phyllosphaerae TaxID=1812349 RepID=A0A4Y8AJV0_9SPHI|nr:ATP-binding protein [Mucilaginibacter phyllosphaerae]MBB3967635.1 signal transduction histidine kinase [Mucilaginibacter phyllosphaerae]TEW69308.1 cyclic nucleotide-binding domain-containing protein [Mucilaginibacter phyllosphaerae]GGH21866.1 sensor histidine kinase [Mucilaginibacter phyllosphaerae]